jgi:hypothetical protein
MNDVATFFRDRQKDSGETYQLTLEGWRGTHRVSVYSQRPIESRALEDQSVVLQQDYDVALKDLRNAVTGSGGGGMIVIANDESRSRTFSVMRVNAKPYAAAQGFVALSPGRDPAFVSIDGNNRGYKCAAGAHALVPVSEEAQQRLQDFLGYLSWLSPDIESLVLNAIRRPSLDRRLDRVETRLFAQTADEALTGANQNLLGKIRNWMALSVPPPVIRVATAVLLAVLIATNGFVLYRLYPRGDVMVVYAAPGKSKLAAVEPFVDDAKALLEALHKSKDPLLRKVDEAHFASLATDEEVQKAFGERPALWGLVKLQMLAIDSQSRSTDFLEAADAVTRTKEAYAAIPQARIPDDARRFLTAAGCRMHYESPMPFESEDCTKVPVEAFEEGLQRLTTFVKGRP